MTMQAFPNNYGTMICPMPLFPEGLPASTTAVAMDAAGESHFAIGRILLSTGIGTSKTLSSAGGKIHWLSGAVTFADAGTTLRVGIQDVTAAGVNDDAWTSEPQADLVGGTDAITANVINSTPIESGSRDIAHGDFIAVGLELISRGGTDSVQVRRANNSAAVSHLALDTGSGPLLTSACGIFTIEFDDGTVGWFEPYSFANLGSTSSVFGSTSTPDEYALVFQIPFKAVAVGLYARIPNLASTDHFEGILYSNPLGTPVAERTIAQNMAEASTGLTWARPFASAFTLEPNTFYAVALRPTTAGTISFQLIDFGTGNGNLRRATMLGTNWSLYSRSDQTGAFGNEVTTQLPIFGVALGQLSDDVGGGGGATGGSAAWWAR